MNKILILGAGLMQKPAILAAKTLGLESVVVDANPNAPCVNLADHFEEVDLKDRDSLLKLARSLGGELVGVFTAGTDFSSSVSYVSEKLGLPAHPFQSALNASDKVRMRTCFKKRGVPCPSFREISRLDIPKLTLEKVNFPMVVKPCDNMGGRGCRLVRSPLEMNSSVSVAVKNSRTGRAIFEDFMEGAEYSIDAIVWEGSLTVTGFADRHIFYPPYFIEMGHSLPSRASSQIKEELFATFALGVKSLGLTKGVAKADIKYTKNGPMIGEIAARLSGGYMSGWTFPYASGINLTEEAMKIAVGQTPDKIIAERRSVAWNPHKSVSEFDCPFELFEIPTNLVSAERAWISIPGKVCAIDGIEEAKAVYGVRDVLPRTKIGDDVDFPRNNVEKCGNVIAVALSSDEAYRSAHTAISRIVLRLSPNNEKTERFLAGKCADDERGFPPAAFVLDENAKKIVCPFPETVLENHSISEFISDEISVQFGEDWNHRSLKTSAKMFDKFCKNHASLSGEKLWNALLRGGLQGAIFVADSAKS